MAMPVGVELRISGELGANALKIMAYRHGALVAILVGYKNHKAQTVRCYPKRIIVYGALSERDLPIECRLDEIPWERR